MKQLLSFFLFLLPFSLYAYQGMTEVRAGYFYPASSLMRDMYHNGGIEGEIETSAKLGGCLSLFGNAGIFIKSGSSIGLNDATKVQIYPLSIGLKYTFCLSSCYELYLGVAPTYTWVRFHDHSPFVEQHVHKSAPGVVAKSGLIYTFWKRWFFDIFFDYYYTHISGTDSPDTTPTSRNIGGFRTGIGLGIKY